MSNTTLYNVVSHDYNYPCSSKSKSISEIEDDIMEGVCFSLIGNDLNKRNKRRFSYSERKFDTAFVLKETNIFTAVTSIQLKVSIEDKSYFGIIENDIQGKQSEIDKMFIKVKDLYEKNKSDSAIVYIFDIIDDWFLDDEYKFDELFQTFYGSKFNEDIYIALLASTISVKHNKFRGMYFRYVKNELNKIHNGKDLNIILSGL